MKTIAKYFERALICLFFHFMLVMAFGCTNNNTDTEIRTETPFQVKYDIEFYDIYLKIDTANDVFLSSQTLQLKPQQKSKTINFDIHSNLDIENLFLTDLWGNTVPIENWKFLYNVMDNRGNEIEKFSRYQIVLKSEVVNSTSINLTVELTMNASKIENGINNELLKFSVSNKGSRALHPVSGFMPYFGGIVTAPFKFDITYPVEDICSIPGTKISKNINGQYIHETFESTVPRIPVFYVGKGQEVNRVQNGISMSYVLAEGQLFDDEIADKTFEIVQLFNEHFGNSGLNDYRVTFIPLNSSSITGESKGNAIYFAYKNPNDFKWDYNGKVNFINLVSHELFHNWNLWNTPWQGSFYEWFVEGGAGFISAWACEKKLGNEAGRIVRKDFVEAFVRNKAYNATQTLENAQKSNSSERSLIYSYGALVWEQLRHKMGDDAFFSGLSDFFANSKSNINGFSNLVADLQAHANFSVSDYLNNWVKRNAKIDLKIDHVQINEINNVFKVDVDFYLQSETNLEVFTAIGYKASVNAEETYIPINLNEAGKHRISFTSESRPKFIQLDPDYIVPQMVLTNDSWSS